MHLRHLLNNRKSHIGHQQYQEKDDVIYANLGCLIGYTSHMNSSMDMSTLSALKIIKRLILHKNKILDQLSSG